MALVVYYYSININIIYSSNGEYRKALDIYESLMKNTGSLDYALALHKAGKFNEAASGLINTCDQIMCINDSIL